MLTKLGKIWKAAPAATVLLVAAIVVALFFGLRTLVFYAHWADPANRDQTIQAWMTPGYVAHSWYVPREVVLEAIAAPTGPDAKRRNFDQLAAYLGVPVDELMTRAQTAIDDYRMLHPAPPREARP